MSGSLNLPIQIDFRQIEKQPIYQNFATKTQHLKKFGLNTTAIARRLSVGYKTVVRASEWIEIFDATN